MYSDCWDDQCILPGVSGSGSFDRAYVWGGLELSLLECSGPARHLHIFAGFVLSKADLLFAERGCLLITRRLISYTVADFTSYKTLSWIVFRKPVTARCLIAE
jgi:hypothetical protein